MKFIISERSSSVERYLTVCAASSCVSVCGNQRNWSTRSSSHVRLLSTCMSDCLLLRVYQSLSITVMKFVTEVQHYNQCKQLIIAANRLNGSVACPPMKLLTPASLCAVAPKPHMQHNTDAIVSHAPNTITRLKKATRHNDTTTEVVKVYIINIGQSQSPMGESHQRRTTGLAELLIDAMMLNRGDFAFRVFQSVRRRKHFVYDTRVHTNAVGACIWVFLRAITIVCRSIIMLPARRNVARVSCRTHRVVLHKQSDVQCAHVYIEMNALICLNVDWSTRNRRKSGQ